MKAILSLAIVLTTWSTGTLADTAIENSLGQQGTDTEFLACLKQPWNSHRPVDLNSGLVNCSLVINRAEVNPAKLIFAFTDCGWIEFELGKLGPNPKALADFNAALSLVPNFRPALAGRAELLLNSSENQKAVADYSKLIDLGPPNSEIFVGRGDAYNNLHEYDLGIADFDQALVLDPKNDDAMNDRAWTLERKGDYAGAIQGYTAVLALGTNLRRIELGNRCEA
jgi:tetratricopeptide (TPR) repeat protein